MRFIFALALIAVTAGSAAAVDCYPKLEGGDTMERVIELCGEPTLRQNLGSDMEVRDDQAGQAKMLTIEHSRTENLWIYKNKGAVYLRFVNGELVEKDRGDRE